MDFTICDLRPKNLLHSIFWLNHLNIGNISCDQIKH